MWKNKHQEHIQINVRPKLNAINLTLSNNTFGIVMMAGRICLFCLTCLTKEQPKISSIANHGRASYLEEWYISVGPRPYILILG